MFYWTRPGARSTRSDRCAALKIAPLPELPVYALTMSHLTLAESAQEPNRDGDQGSASRRTGAEAGDKYPGAREPLPNKPASKPAVHEPAPQATVSLAPEEKGGFGPALPF
jgi:hypothetical protein